MVVVYYNIMDFDKNSSSGPSAGANPSGATPSNTKSLTSIEVTNENEALNLLVSFLNLAQRRGMFSFDESAKIWECIKMFQK